MKNNLYLCGPANCGTNLVKAILGVNQKIHLESDNTSKNIENNNDKNKGNENIKEEKVAEILDHKNFVKILESTIVLVCFLSIKNDEVLFNKIIESIKDDNEIYNILLDQLKSSWNRDVELEIFEEIIKHFMEISKTNYNIDQHTKLVKVLIINNRSNREELSKLIDNYIIPQALEKKTNAEVSTPYELRQEMLDTITKYGDKDFWKTPKTVFEPCCGKGGFLVDIIDRFMNDLQIEDEEERYKVIVEQCLYFCDINPTNIFICKTLIVKNTKMGDKSRPPIAGTILRNGAITGSVSLCNNNISGL